MSAESVINNPPKEFTEPCVACGVSEFQLGVRHAEERIIKLLEAEGCHCTPDPEVRKCYPHNLIALIKGEQK